MKSLLWAIKLVLLSITPVVLVLVSIRFSFGTLGDRFEPVWLVVLYLYQALKGSFCLSSGALNAE